jgi:hypothetical protein
MSLLDKEGFLIRTLVFFLTKNIRAYYDNTCPPLPFRCLYLLLLAVRYSNTCFDCVFYQKLIFGYLHVYTFNLL